MFTRTACVACLLAPAGFAGVSRGAAVVFPVSSGGTGHAYEVVVDGSATAAAARGAANDAGGHLITITSASEQSFVEELLDSVDAPSGSYWFGLERVDDETFKWGNGESFGYNSFAPGEPNNFLGAETAGQIYWSRDLADDVNNRRGNWNDAPAAGYPVTDIDDLVRTGYIVERPATATDPDFNGDGNGNGGSGGGGDPDLPPVAIPLPPAVLAAPLAMLVAGLAARRRRQA